MRERLAFLHLPKSAGTSYRHAIARFYAPAETVPWSFDRWMFGDHPGVDAVPQPILLDDHADLSSYRYMEGHFALSTIEQGFAPADVVCILREPRARFLSHYTFWRGWGPELRDQWLPYDVPRAARQRLVDYCQDAAAAHQSDNLIARLIVGPHPLIPADAMISHDDHAELTALAIDRLDSIGFLGILEDGDATFDALERWFGEPLERSRLNETDLDEGPALVADELTDPAARRALDDRTVIDRALWRHAAARAGRGDQAATELGEMTFAVSMSRLIERARDSTSRVPNGTVAPVPTSSAVKRIVGLLRRGPRIVASRAVAAVRRRRS